MTVTDLPCRRTVGAGGIAGGAALFAAARAGAGGPAMLAPDAMRGDVALLRRAYETLHPGLLRYATPAGMTARFDALAAACARPMSLAAFYLQLSRFLAGIRCGHSYANFYNQSKAVQAALFDAPDRLPLRFLWLGDRMIVTEDPFGTGIARGSEVLAIDGRPAGDILARLMPLARADGHNDAKRRRLLSVQGEDGYETFDIFFSLLFGRRDRYRLTVAGPNGRRRTAIVAAGTLAQRRAQRGPLVDATGDTPAWTIERRDGAAVLTMPGWGLYNSKWDWRGWLDAQVDRLIADRVGRLVIDLRGNEGGMDCGDALAERLIAAPLPVSTSRRLVRYRAIPADLRPALDTWDRAFDDWGKEAVPFDDRFLELAGPERGTTVLAPRGRRYAGEVRLLIGPQNSSATFQFADMMQRARLATLVGASTGGNRRGINGGAFYFLRLPGSGLEADLPLIGTFPRDPQPDAGVMPDVPVPVTRADIAAGRDAAMARALA